MASKAKRAEPDANARATDKAIGDGELDSPAKADPVGVRVVTALELVTARTAGSVVANAAGDAALDRDPNAAALSEVKLAVVAMRADADPVEALRQAADTLAVRHGRT